MDESEKMELTQPPQRAGAVASAPGVNQALDPVRMRARGKRLLRNICRRKSWSIRSQMYFGTSILLIIVFILAVAGIQGVLKFRSLTKIIRDRATELPLSAQLSQEVSDLRVSFAKAEGARQQGERLSHFNHQLITNDVLYCENEFYTGLEQVRATLNQYEEQLQSISEVNSFIADVAPEIETTKEIRRLLDEIELADTDWVFSTSGDGQTSQRLDELQARVQDLPTFLKQRMDEFADNARANYHAWLAFSVALLLAAFLLICSLAIQFRKWIFKPLQALIAGSREVAAGNYSYRIRLGTEDEMAELANALNEMTSSFQAIRRDLNDQVRQRTREVVRSEQMASVGFLAAGVAHEINNPLAAIAWSAESLEMRIETMLIDATKLTAGSSCGAKPAGNSPAATVSDFPRIAAVESERDALEPTAYEQESTQPDSTQPDSTQQDIDEIKTYLRRIQDEAFRCKEITGSLLDFSRLGDASRQPTNLVELVQGVIDMVRPLSKYRRRNILFHHDPVVSAEVIAHELKQVVLNLLTNALDSVAEQGNVEVSLRKSGTTAILQIADDGCGMTDEVRQHLFEPFFTRRADGKGTGLGLSITYRIIDEHGGKIEALSDGPGQGATFDVRLPLEPSSTAQLTAA